MEKPNTIQQLLLALFGVVLFMMPTPARASGVPGDLNDDMQVNVSDVTFLIDVLLNGEPQWTQDVNGDGKVNIRDVTAIQRKLANYDEPGFNEAAADINGEGLDINDATLIQKYLAEYDLPYSIGERIA